MQKRHHRSYHFDSHGCYRHTYSFADNNSFREYTEACTLMVNLNVTRCLVYISMEHCYLINLKHFFSPPSASKESTISPFLFPYIILHCLIDDAVITALGCVFFSSHSLMN